MKYFYSHDGTHRQGPVTLDDLRRARLFPTTIIWHDGLAGWLPAPSLPELTDLFHPAGQTTPQPAIPVQHPYTAPSIQPIPRSANGLAVASMVLGIVSLVMSPCLWFVSVIPGALAIVFGHVARRQVRWGNGGGSGLALAGLILGYLSVTLSLAFMVFFTMAFSSPRSTPAMNLTPTPSSNAPWDKAFHSGGGEPPLREPVPNSVPTPLPGGKPGMPPAR